MKRRKIDREKIYAAATAHPGLPVQERLDLIVRAVVDALCDELER